jgi:hypothetical protein
VLSGGWGDRIKKVPNFSCEMRLKVSFVVCPFLSKTYPNFFRLGQQDMRQVKEELSKEEYLESLKLIES